MPAVIVDMRKVSIDELKLMLDATEDDLEPVEVISLDEDEHVVGYFIPREEFKSIAATLRLVKSGQYDIVMARHAAVVRGDFSEFKPLDIGDTDLATEESGQRDDSQDFFGSADQISWRSLTADGGEQGTVPQQKGDTE